MTFVDTSALIALLNKNDNHHAECAEAWASITDEPRRLITTNYVVVETTALIHRRMGLAAVNDLLSLIMPLIAVKFVDEALHQAAVNFLIAQGNRHLSFVDCSSFLFMRRAAIAEAFTVDEDFTKFGFTAVPSP